MVSVGVTMPLMADKRKPGRPKAGGRKPAYVVYARIDPALGGAFDRFVSEARPRTDKTGGIELAIEELLRARGYWPPPAPPPQ